MDITSFRLQQHAYTGIKLNGTGDAGIFEVKGKITDSLLRVSVDMNTAVNQQYPSATGTVIVENADLYALGFYKDPFKFRSTIDIQLKNLSPDNLDAFLRLDSSIVYKSNKWFRVDSIIAKGSMDSGKTLLSLQAPFADVSLKGDYKYNELANILMDISKNILEIQ